MQNQIKIVDGVTLENLNPQNYAMKNEYTANMLSTAFMVLPIVSKMIDKPVIVVKGFLTGSYLRDRYAEDYTSNIERHSRGLAIQMTWNKFNPDIALNVAYELFSGVGYDPQEKIKILIDNDTKTLYFGRDFKFSHIAEKISGEERIIRKQDN